MAELKILSFNTQGLGGIKKQKDVFHYLKNKEFDIYFCKTRILQKVRKGILEIDGKEIVTLALLNSQMLEESQFFFHKN